MTRLPSSIEAAETENMDFNTQCAQDFDQSFNLLESGSAYSPSPNELQKPLGNFQSVATSYNPSVYNAVI